MSDRMKETLAGYARSATRPLECYWARPARDQFALTFEPLNATT
jgi:hypothetical protein